MGRQEKSRGLAPPSIRKEIRAKQARQIVNKVIPALLASNARAKRGAESSELHVDPKQETLSTQFPPMVAVSNTEEAVYVTRKGQGRRKLKGRAGITDDEIVTRAEHANDGRAKSKKDRKHEGVDINVTTQSSAPRHSPSLSPRRIRIMATNTLTAAHILSYPSHDATSTLPTTKAYGKAQNVCILNMASPLRPGGGVLTGATSQEEFLCARTTLLPSLRESFYRLPELGGVWTSDVLVFRSPGPLGDNAAEIGQGLRYWVDIITAGMLRFPELEGAQDEVKKLCRKDCEMVEAKMRAVLRIAVRKRVRRLVLGAWGCGAYGNPVADIARIWRKVLDPTSVAPRHEKCLVGREAEGWESLEEVVFAITDSKMAADFARAFGNEFEVEADPVGIVDEAEERGDDSVTEELRAKVREMEGQVDKVWNPELKIRMGMILEGLKRQLKEREEEGDAGENDEESEDGVEAKAPNQSSHISKVHEEASEEEKGEEENIEELIDAQGGVSLAG